jgi:hypothetical protein
VLKVCLLPSLSKRDADLFTEALKQALASLTASTPALAETISIILSRHCAEAVAPAKSAPAQVRANKRAPNEPSPFVTAILKPVKAFFGIQATDGGGARLKADLLVSCATDAFDGACKRYVALRTKVLICLNILTDILTT